MGTEVVIRTKAKGCRQLKPPAAQAVWGGLGLHRLNTTSPTFGLRS